MSMITGSYNKTYKVYNAYNFEDEFLWGEEDVSVTPWIPDILEIY